MSLWVLFEYVLYFIMIENYKGWDITLNWDNKDISKGILLKIIFLIIRKMDWCSLKW